MLLRLLRLFLFLSWKAINDASIFSADSIKSRFNKIKSKIIGMFKKTRIVYMGTPEFAVAPLDELIKNGYNVVGVVTVADKARANELRTELYEVAPEALRAALSVCLSRKLDTADILYEVEDNRVKQDGSLIDLIIEAAEE